MTFKTAFSGFGGQGVLMMGYLLALAAMNQGRNVTYLPAYGAEVRGGTANCTVVVSDKPVGSPIVHHPVAALVMNQPSLVKFGPMVKSRGQLVVNASLISQADVDELQIKGPRIIMVPAIALAAEVGNDRLANMVMLGTLVAAAKVVPLTAVIDSLAHALDKRYHSMIPINSKALQAGAEFAARG
ncbi:MAG: 2-oxoacid:acceptor oxidoreductase family protein [Proteobacteria bacterium]|nr:2-oxoacid:acceptor oxidoreductase family protein [Pseudomonadota bacterium]